MAMRRGLALRDMEMVQFHPTGLLAGAGTKMTGTVLEEGLRGAGGHLMNGDQQRFMFDYDAGGERATRDIVSRAIYEEMRQGRTSPHGGVYISMAHLGPQLVAEKFKGMVKRCADSGFDLAAGLVEVVPTAHYLMGGVVVDTDTRTALPGLYVAGEDAGGAHGSNRLGGNGVANSTVYGGVAGDVMGQDCLKMQALHDPDETVLDEEMARATAPFAQKPGDVTALRDKLLDVMWEDVGVMRDAGGLQRGLQRIDEIDDALSSTGVAADNLAFNLSWHDWLNLRSLVDMSRVIAQSALSRENSRGAHFREDHPDAGAMQDSYFTLATGSDKNISVARAPVQFTIVKPGETLLGADEAETLVGAAE